MSKLTDKWKEKFRPDPRGNADWAIPYKWGTIRINEVISSIEYHKIKYDVFIDFTHIGWELTFEEACFCGMRYINDKNNEKPVYIPWVD